MTDSDLEKVEQIHCTYYQSSGKKVPKFNPDSYNSRILNTYYNIIKEYTDDFELILYVISELAKWGKERKIYSMRHIADKNIILKVCDKIQVKDKILNFEFERIKSSINYMSNKKFTLENITRGYLEGRLTEAYLALSEPCQNLLRGADDITKAIMPTSEILRKIRADYFINKDKWDNARKILGNQILQL